MSKKKIQVHLLLPNGKKKNFTFTPGSNWKSTLREELKKMYPKSDEVRFVDEPGNKRLQNGGTFKSNVMFEIRENYYVLGHVTATNN